MDQQIDDISSQLHEWTEAALALDAGHFPRELLNELEDIVAELRQVIDEHGSDFDRDHFTEQFVNPEMAEVVVRFRKVSRMLERVLGAEFIEQLEEEAQGFEVPSDDDED